MVNNEKALSGERKEGSMDSIDTFASCFTSFTHPFNSLADLDEDQFKQQAVNSRENKSLLRNQSRIGDLRLSVSQLNNDKKSDRELPPRILDINRNHRGEDLKER